MPRSFPILLRRIPSAFCCVIIQYYRYMIYSSKAWLQAVLICLNILIIKYCRSLAVSYRFPSRANFTVTTPTTITLLFIRESLWIFLVMCLIILLSADATYKLPTQIPDFKRNHSQLYFGVFSRKNERWIGPTSTSFNPTFITGSNWHFPMIFPTILPSNGCHLIIASENIWF